MEHLALTRLALSGLTALTLGGTALITAAPAEAQGRGGYEVDADEDDLDGPRVQRRLIDADEDDDLPRGRRRVIDDDEDEPRVDRRVVERRTVERRITERRVVQPVVERRIIERRPVVQVVERPVFVAPVVRPVVYAYPRPVVRRAFYPQPVYRTSRVVYRQPVYRSSPVVVRDRFYGGRGSARFDNRRFVTRATFRGDRFDSTGSVGRGRAFRY